MERGKLQTEGRYGVLRLLEIGEGEGEATDRGEDRERSSRRREEGEERRRKKKNANESWPLNQIGGPGFVCGEIRAPLREERIRIR